MAGSRGVVLLARHGQTDANAPPQRVQGWLDPPLNAVGRDQAEALGRDAAQRGIRSLHTSGLRRAVETAAAVGRVTGLDPVVDERLAESNRGSWEGRLIEEIERDEPELWAAWRRGGETFRFPGGESLLEHADRVAAALDAVRSAPLPALVICHGGTIRCAFALSHPRGLDAFHELEVPNGVIMQLPG